jgi:hypothetical protein
MATIQVEGYGPTIHYVPLFKISEGDYVLSISQYTPH